MGNLAYPALAIRPPEQPDLLGQAGKMMQIQGMQQENQMRGQQIKDGQAVTAAMQAWDGKSLDDLPGLLLKHGASSTAVFGMKDKILEHKSKLSTMAAQDAETGTKNFTLQQNKNDALLGRLQAVTSGDDAGLPTRLMQTAQQSVQDGLLDPPHAQMVQQLLQQTQDPQVLRQSLSLFEKSMQGQKEQFAQIQKERETAAQEQTAQSHADTAATAASKFTAEQPGIAARNTIAQQEAAMSPQQRGLAGNLFYGAAGGNKQAQRALSLETQQKIEAAKAAAAGAPGAVSGVAPHLVGPATAAFTKAGEEYATAYQAAQNMGDFLAQAKSGNKEAVKIVPLQGALEITTAQGVHRINRTEVDQFGGAGNAYDKLAGAIGGAISGKNITDSVLADMDKLQQVVSQNAKTLHANKVSVINKSYGSKFEPMDFSGNQNQSRSGGPPAGATMKVPGSDGKMHWSDGKKDLGVIE